MINKLTISVVIATAALLTGCFKSVSYQTLYILRPSVQLSSTDNQIPLETGVEAYAYYADTAQWTVASYEDALAHTITAKTGEKRSAPDAIAEAYAGDGDKKWLAMTVDNPTIMVVAIDTEHKIYGYRQQNLGENLSPLYVNVLFTPWRDEKVYTSQDRQWRMFNDFGVSYLTNYSFFSKIQQTDGEEELPLTDGVDLYAYYVDASEWTVASYDDAVSRVITARTGGEKKTTPDAIGTLRPSADNNELFMTMDSHYVMVVAVDTDNRLYAYAKIELFVNKFDLSTTFVFRPWKTGTEYSETFDRIKWSVFNDFYTTPEPPPAE